MKKIINLSGLVLSGVLLSACGGDGGSDQNQIVKPKPDQNVIESTEGRLLFIDDNVERPELSLYDLSQSKTIQQVQLSKAPTALYASPAYRYGVLLDRNNGEVNFYDSGLSRLDKQIFSGKPQLLAFQLFGASPTHYRHFNDQAAIFYDGNAEKSSKFDVFKDQDILNKTIASQNLPFKHHGVAEPRGEIVLSTYLPAGESKVSIVKSYGQHGDHYHEEQTLTNPCPGLHGASSISKFSAFGCEDGVLVVEQQGQKFIDFKIPLSVRIGTVVGNVNAPSLVGISSASNLLYVIDPVNKSTKEIAWTDQVDVKKLKQAYSSTGQYFVVLDSTGVINVLDAKTWQITQRVPALNGNAAALAKAQLVMHGYQNLLFINDTQNKAVVKIDLATGVIKRIELNTVPNMMTWLGVK